MDIKERLLTPNEWSRPGYRLRQVLGVVMHWTANPHADALANVRFFENRKAGTAGYGSAHYVISQTGDVVRCIPESEVAYHCGSSKTDPASGKVYTDLARQLFGAYCGSSTSPNFCTLGIEMCPTEEAGSFTEATEAAAVELVADILRRYELGTAAVVTHHGVVGWKDCPRLWVARPELFEAFKLKVAVAIGEVV